MAVEQHETDDCLTCSKCDKRFANARNLLRHPCERNELHACVPCGKVFARYDYLRRHLHLVHEGDVHMSAPCESCGRDFSRKDLDDGATLTLEFDSKVLYNCHPRVLALNAEGQSLLSSWPSVAMAT